jgi:hypothetical protein
MISIAFRLSARGFKPTRVPTPPVAYYNSIPNRGRYLTSTTRSPAALVKELAARAAILVYSPSPESLEEEELDVELLQPHDIKLRITEHAAEV